jgi:SAM-dependent methyltransferase
VVTTEDLGRPLAERIPLRDWPDRERRRPSRGEPSYLALSALAEGILESVEREFAGRHDLRVLDIGCGNKPYLPLLAHRAVSWRGLDVVPGPQVDDIGAAEQLPYADRSFDLVLCTQVLEHLRSPEQAVSEIRRVLTPGGVALVSTHGVHVYHPNPPGSDQDYWRWTHAGLGLLFERQAEWAAIEVSPCRHALACMVSVAAIYANLALGKIGAAKPGWVLLCALNVLGELLDTLVPRTLRTPRGGSLSANYLVVARRSGP